MQAQASGFADGKNADDEPKLGVPTPNFEVHSSSQQHQVPGLPPKGKPLWAAPLPRRQPMSLGLSLKQQVSSPRCDKLHCCWYNILVLL